jgi:hypothetical protein
LGKQSHFGYKIIEKNSGEASLSAAFKKQPLFQGKPQHWSKFKTLEGLVVALRIKETCAHANLEIFPKGVVVFKSCKNAEFIRNYTINQPYFRLV